MSTSRDPDAADAKVTDPRHGADDQIRTRVLSRFFSRVEPREHADIYAVRKLPQEIRATLNGLYSRSHLSMRETFLKRLEQGLATQGKELGDLPLPDSSEDVLSRVLVDKAGVFLRTYAIDHGHNSLREGAMLHLAVEQVSQLVTRFMQRERRASFEESSTRYISFSKQGHWHDPDVLAAGSPWADLYRNAIDESFEFYQESIALLRDHLTATRPPDAGDDPKAYKRAVRAEAFDSARYLLTPALHTKFGLVADARTVADMVTELCSHPLAEFRIVGDRLKQEAEKEVPTLLVHAGENSYRKATRDEVRDYTQTIGSDEAVDGPGELSVRLLDAPTDLDERLLVSLLYEQGSQSYETLAAHVLGLAASERQSLFERFLSTRGKRDAMPEGFEGAGVLDYEMLVDFGAYRDIARHRKGFQQQQPLTTQHGFAMPPLFEEAGLADRYCRVMASVADKVRRLAESFPNQAGYVVPFGFLQRARVRFDAQQMAYFIELRSAPEGHFSYREIAIAMARELEHVAPLYAQWIRVCTDSVVLGRVEAERERDEIRRRREQRANELGFET